MFLRERCPLPPSSLPQLTLQVSLVEDGREASHSCPMAPPVDVILRDEQTDLTRHLRTLATGRAQGSFPTTCVLCGNQFSSQVGSISTHLQTPRVHQQSSLVESGEQQGHHQAERARPGRSQLERPTGTPGEVLSWASVREAEISKVS